jgi:hypothetical protein
LPQRDSGKITILYSFQKVQSYVMPCNKNEITCKLGKDDAYDKVDGD